MGDIERYGVKNPRFSMMVGVPAGLRFGLLGLRDLTDREVFDVIEHGA